MAETDSSCTKPRKVIRLAPKPRQKVHDLMQIGQGMSRTAMLVLGYAVNEYAGKYPRHPVDISVNTNGLHGDLIKILGTSELVSDKGLDELTKKALELDKKYPRHPETTADILSFRRQ